MKNGNTIAIITTDYWHHEKHNFKIFGDVESKLIPFWNIGAFPNIYNKFLTDKVEEILLSGNMNLVSHFLEIESIKRLYNLGKANRQSDYYRLQLFKSTKAIPKNYWGKKAQDMQLFPDNLIFKKIKNCNLYVLPSLDENTKFQHEDKTWYIDFLIEAWEKTFNNSVVIDDSYRFIFILHEKDLGLGREYKEKVLTKQDFLKNSNLQKYCTEEKLNNLGDQYEIVVYQHDSMNSPNINKEFLIKDTLVDNPIGELERIIQLLKVPWDELYCLRNKLIKKLLIGNEINADIRDFLSKFDENINTLKEYDPDFVEKIFSTTCTMTAEDIKIKFDLLFQNIKLSSIL